MAARGIFDGLKSGEEIFPDPACSPTDVATAVVELAIDADRANGKAFIVSGKDLEAVPA